MYSATSRAARAACCRSFAVATATLVLAVAGGCSRPPPSPPPTPPSPPAPAAVDFAPALREASAPSGHRVIDARLAPYHVASSAEHRVAGGLVP